MINAIMSGHRGPMRYRPVHDLVIVCDKDSWCIRHPQPIVNNLRWSRGGGFTAAPFTNLQCAVVAAIDLGLLPAKHIIDLTLVDAL